MYSVDEHQAKETMNRFLVDIFNQILGIEEDWLKDQFAGDLTLAETHMLVAIGEREHGAMSDVARHAALTNGTVTTAVKKLEKKGYVIRTRDEEDRRKLRVRLTDRGQVAVQAHEAFHTALCDGIWTNLDEGMRTPFVKGLSEAIQVLEGMREDLK